MIGHDYGDTGICIQIRSPPHLAQSLFFLEQVLGCNPAQCQDDTWLDQLNLSLQITRTRSGLLR